VVCPQISSNKRRGVPRPSTKRADSTAEKHPSPKPPLIQLPPKVIARATRPLWRYLILRVWDTYPLLRPGCEATLHPVDTFHRSGEVEFFLRLHKLLEWKRNGRRKPKGWSGSDIKV
jgi:hypothetical protein